LLRKLRYFIPLLALVGMMFLTTQPAHATLEGAKVYNPAMAWNYGGYTYTVKLTFYKEKLPGGCRPFIKAEGFRNGSPYSMNFQWWRPALYRSDGLLLFDPYWQSGGYLSGTGSVVQLGSSTWYTSATPAYRHGATHLTEGDFKATAAGEGIWHHHYDGVSNDTYGDCD